MIEEFLTVVNYKPILSSRHIYHLPFLLYFGKQFLFDLMLEGVDIGCSF